MDYATLDFYLILFDGCEEAACFSVIVFKRAISNLDIWVLDAETSALVSDVPWHFYVVHFKVWVLHKYGCCKRWEIILELCGFIARIALDYKIRFFNFQRWRLYRRNVPENWVLKDRVPVCVLLYAEFLKNEIIEWLASPGHDRSRFFFGFSGGEFKSYLLLVKSFKA